MKQIKLVFEDGNIAIFDEQTSEAIWMYAKAKNITVEAAINEAFKHLIKLKEENESTPSS